MTDSTDTATHPPVEEARADAAAAQERAHEAEQSVVEEAIEAVEDAVEEAIDTVDQGTDEVAEAQADVAEAVQEQAEEVAETLGLSDAEVDGIAERIWQKIAPRLEAAAEVVGDAGEAVVESAPIQPDLPEEPAEIIVPAEPEIAEAAAAVEEATDPIRPKNSHWWYDWPPPFLNRRR